MTVLHAYVTSSCAACYTLVEVAGNNLTNGLSECGVTKQALQNTACIAVVGNVGNTWWKVYLPVVKAIWKGRSFCGIILLDLESQLQRFPFAFHLDDAPAALHACTSTSTAALAHAHVMMSLRSRPHAPRMCTCAMTCSRIRVKLRLDNLLSLEEIYHATDTLHGKRHITKTLWSHGWTRCNNVWSV